jgi:hypothetical protein
MDEELALLHLAYTRALEEPSEASSVVYDSIRERVSPTDEQLARKRHAQIALAHACRALFKAIRRKQPASPLTARGPAEAV